MWDVPLPLCERKHDQKSSPRMWGCSVLAYAFCRAKRGFPTNVGMFLMRRKLRIFSTCLSHECRDVPLVPLSLVFPTNVGMFPCGLRLSSAALRLPHECGDVPSVTEFFPISYKTSPRSWGCSHYQQSSTHFLTKMRVHTFW